jgi:hypothetical protein
MVFTLLLSSKPFFDFYDLDPNLIREISLKKAKDSRLLYPKKCFPKSANPFAPSKNYQKSQRYDLQYIISCLRQLINSV